MDTEKRLRAVQEENKTELNMDPVPTNDLEYEDKQKSQESQLVYDGLRFNLLAHSSKPQTQTQTTYLHIELKCFTCKMCSGGAPFEKHWILG